MTARWRSQMKVASLSAGFRPFPVRPGVVVTNEGVNALREAEGI